MGGIIVTRILIVAAIAALVGGCSGSGLCSFGSGSMDSYMAIQSKADCARASPEELAADEAQARPICAQSERHRPDDS